MRRRLPGEEQDRHEPQGDQHGAGRRPPRHGTRPLGLLPVDRPARSRPDPARHRQGQPGPRAAVRVLRRLRRLRRDAVHPPGQPAVRRPDDRRQRDGLLVDLRRQPADDAVDGQCRGPGSGLEQLAVRGQRRVRTRDAARARRADRPRPPAGRAPGARDRRGSREGDPRRHTGDGGRDRRPARQGRLVARRAHPDRRPGRQRCPAPADARLRPRPPGRLDHRRRRLGLRHRVRWRGPGPVVRSQRQHPGPRHGGLLQHRWPVVEGDAAWRRGQVRGRRQGHRQEGPRRDRAFVRQRLRRAGLDGRERPADDQGAARGGRLAGTVAGHRVQHLHRPRHRHVEVDEPPEGRGQERLLAAVSLPSRRRSRAASRSSSTRRRRPSRSPTSWRPRRASRSSSGRTRSGPPSSPLLAQSDADERWHYYEQLAGIERTVPHIHRPDPDIVPEVESDAGYRYEREGGTEA